MTLRQFARKQGRIAIDYGPLTAGRFALKEIRRKVGPKEITSAPDGCLSQNTLLDQALAGESNVWIFWFDGGRVDYFKELYPEYLSGELQACWNGGIGYSGDWADRHLRRDMNGKGLFSVAPVRSLSGTDYDGREYFDVAPEIDTGDSVQERLAALGYREKKADHVVNISPGHCNRSVREHLSYLDGGIIRYLKPHPPFEGMEDMSSGSQKTRNTWYALWSGETSHREIEQAYIETYRQAFEAACEIIPELDGQIIITADHGECLGDCGQLYHGRGHDTHEHLCKVPWFTVDGLVDKTQ